MVAKRRRVLLAAAAQVDGQRGKEVVTAEAVGAAADVHDEHEQEGRAKSSRADGKADVRRASALLRAHAPRASPRGSPGASMSSGIR